MTIRNKEKQKIYQREWMRARRFEWFSKNGPCVKCGSNENLELDHIDPSLKETHAIRNWKEERRNIELDKCQLLCSRCHGIKTGRENAVRFAKPIIHGTYGGYQKKCRCEPCCSARKELRKNWPSTRKNAEKYKLLRALNQGEIPNEDTVLS